MNVHSLHVVFMKKEKSEKYEQILAAAEKMIAEFGFHGLSMQKLAREAGVAAGTIYLYFTDKQDLLEKLRLKIAQRIADAVQANVDEFMSLKEQFCTMWINIWKLANASADTLINQVQYDSLSHTVRKRVWEWEQEKHLFYKVESLFNQGKQQGLFKPFDNKILSGLSFEVTVNLARKQSLGLFNIGEHELHTIMEAAWDAIIIHTPG